MQTAGIGLDRCGDKRVADHLHYAVPVLTIVKATFFLKRAIRSATRGRRTHLYPPAGRVRPRTAQSHPRDLLLEPGVAARRVGHHPPGGVAHPRLLPHHFRAQKWLGSEGIRRTVTHPRYGSRSLRKIPYGWPKMPPRWSIRPLRAHPEPPT